jgi:hypothetical protein
MPFVDDATLKKLPPGVRLLLESVHIKTRRRNADSSWKPARSTE